MKHAFTQIGFDDLFNTMEKLSNHTSYPFYDLVKLENKDNKEHYVIQLAVAGYAKDDIEITHDKNTLTVKGKPNHSVYHHYDEGVNVIAANLATRSFTKSFTVSDDFDVAATVKDGILSVHLTRSKKQPEIKVISIS